MTTNTDLKHVEGDKSSIFTKLLWFAAVALILSNGYTLNLLYEAKTKTQLSSINSKVEDILIPRRQILSTINFENNINNNNNNNNDNNYEIPNLQNILNDKNSAKSYYRSILETQDDAADDALFKAIHGSSDADAIEFEKNNKAESDINNKDKENKEESATNDNNKKEKDKMAPETMEEFYSSIDESSVLCDYSIEYLFNHSINLLYSMKSKNYMEIMTCPNEAQIGWRPHGFVPWIFGNQCESWWHRDAVFIMSHLLNKNMKALEYGSGASTLWMSHFVGYVIGIENDQIWFDRMQNLTKVLQINNVEIRKFRVHIPYVEIDFSSNPGGFDWSLSNGGGIDFISIDGRVRIHCMKWAIKRVKQHGGILLLDNSDRIGDDGINATNLVPKHWLRFDSYNLPQHLKQLSNTRWLENSRTTIWITRHPKCMEN